MEMKRQILDPAGIEIYVENRDSALFPQIAEAPASIFPGGGSLRLSADGAASQVI
jgi:hypothetical protein